MFTQVIKGEQPDEPLDLVKCPSCARKMTENALKRHVKNCKKVFIEAVIPKDMKEIRMTNEMREVPKTEDRPIPVKKAPKWKLQRELMRRALSLDVPKEQFGDGKTTEPPLPIEDDRVGCPHCARKFNDDALKKHVDICLKVFSKNNAAGGLKKGSGAAGGAKTNIPPSNMKENTTSAATTWKMPNMSKQAPPKPLSKTTTTTTITAKAKPIVNNRKR
jgi:hypothetical protein